jgi:hypothetical protein
VVFAVWFRKDSNKERNIVISWHMVILHIKYTIYATLQKNINMEKKLHSFNLLKLRNVVAKIINNFWVFFLVLIYNIEELPGC